MFDIKIYYYLKGLEISLSGLYHWIWFAQQYDIAFGEHGTLRSSLNDWLLVCLDDRVYLRTAMIVNSSYINC